MDLLPRDTLRVVLLLLPLERAIDEELLQPLVAVVDAQLLEGIDLRGRAGSQR
jgi:hypothetical protein